MIETMQPWHLMSAVMRARDADISEMALVDGLDRQRWACSIALGRGLSFTITDRDGLPVVCMGLTEEGNGLATAWMVATPGWCRHVKSALKIWNTVRREAGYRRIQTMIAPGRPEAVKFIKHLGFKRDGELPKICSDGGTMDLYSYT